MQINVILTASATGFNRALSSARSNVGGFGKMLTSTRSLVTGFGAALAGLAGAGSIANLVRGSMAYADELGKTSDQLGIATEKLAGYHHAANLGGVSTAGLDKSLLKMVKNISTAARKGDEAKHAFNELGLSATELSRMSPDKQFDAVADALERIPNQSDKVRLALEISGREGADLLSVMKGGSAAIHEAAAEADKLGISFNRVDAAKIEAANDSWARMTGLITGVGNQLAVELAPYMDAFASKMVEVGTEGEGMGAIVSGSLEWVGKSIAVVADMWDVLHLAFLYVQKGITVGLANWSRAMAKVGEGVKWLAGLVGVKVDLGGFVSSFADSLDEAAKEIDGKIADKMVGPSSGEKVTKFFDDIRREADAAAQEIADSVKPIPLDLEPDVDKLNDVLDSKFDPGKSIYDQTRTPLEQFQNKLTELKDLAEFGFIDEETFSRAVQQAKDELEGSLDIAAESKPGQATALEKGSQAAFSAINRRMSSATDPNAKSAKSLEDLVKLAKKADKREAARAAEARQELAVLAF